MSEFGPDASSQRTPPSGSSDRSSGPLAHHSITRSLSRSSRRELELFRVDRAPQPVPQVVQRIEFRESDSGRGGS